MTSARLDAEMPTTATIAAMPMAMPRAVSAVRERRARSPIVPTRARSTSAQPARRRVAGSSQRSCRRPATTSVGDPAVEDGDAPGARAAISRSWVISTIVRPRWWRSTRSPMMASLVRLSRLPVGSSARTIAGSPTSARAMATRWRSPPESAPGRCSARSARPTASSASPARASRCRRGTPAYSSPSATFSSAVSRSTRWNCWKTKPMRRPRTAVRRRSPSRLMSPSVDADGAARRPLQRADDVHQRRLAGPRRPDDDDELARRRPSGRRRRAPAPAAGRGSAW